MSLSHTLSQLQAAVHICQIQKPEEIPDNEEYPAPSKKPRPEHKMKSPRVRCLSPCTTVCNRIIETLPCQPQVLHSLTSYNFQVLLMEKNSRHQLPRDRSNMTETRELTMLENVINAFCSQENTVKIADTLLKNDFQ